jgi:YggT family protein
MIAILISFIQTLAYILNILILIRVLLSWIPAAQNNRLAVLIFEITDPIIAPIRRLIPSLAGLDFSPLIALLFISMAEQVLVNILSRFA